MNLIELYNKSTLIKGIVDNYHGYAMVKGTSVYIPKPYDYEPLVKTIYDSEWKVVVLRARQGNRIRRWREQCPGFRPVLIGEVGNDIDNLDTLDNFSMSVSNNWYKATNQQLKTSYYYEDFRVPINQEYNIKDSYVLSILNKHGKSTSTAPSD